MLLWSSSIILLICGLANAPIADSQSVSFGHFTAMTEPVLLSNATSSEVLNFTGVQSKFDCLSACQRKGCILASFNPNPPAAAVCQLVLVNDASHGPLLAGTHVDRLVGFEPGARLWTANNFKELLRNRMLNITFVFKNTSTGRTGSIQFVTIASTGCYRIEVAGASGGIDPFNGFAGGSGAFVSGDFNLTTGTQLTVVVGQAGGRPVNLYSGGGGGGGSFVYRTADEFLLAAAGGGGSASYANAGQPGEAGPNGSDTKPYGHSVSQGGINGEPGFNNPGTMPTTHNHGGCGAGWLGKPVNPRRSSNDGDSGGSRAEGWVGGAAGGSNTGAGGFGGGGGGGVRTSVYAANGAGGGFSGGGTGYHTGPPGGGGGSFCAGKSCSGTTGGNGGEHGLVVIRLLVPLGGACD